MTTIEQYQQHMTNGWAPLAPAAPIANRAVVSLTEWAEAARAAHEVSQVLCRTPFVPVAYRDNPYAATAAILAGDELGFSPMASINAFDVIEGRAAPKAITLRAIVQSRGHEIWVHESTDQRAVVRGRRAGGSHVEESVWTIQRARTMKLSDRKQWQLQPTAMLLARATSECCRLVAADAILGIPYSAEEAADEVVEAIAPAADPGPQRTVQRRTRTTTQRPAPAGSPSSPSGASPPAGAPAAGDRAAAPRTPSAGPPLPGEDGYDEPEVAPDDRLAPTDPATKPQNRHMHALFREAQCTNRDERLQLTGLLLNRQIDTSAGLTVADAQLVIDALLRLQASGHPEGLSGAVGDLLNEDDLKRAATEEQAAQAEQAVADDDARAES